MHNTLIIAPRGAGEPPRKAEAAAGAGEEERRWCRSGQPSPHLLGRLGGATECALAPRGYVGCIREAGHLVQQLACMLDARGPCLLALACSRHTCCMVRGTMRDRAGPAAARRGGARARLPQGGTPDLGWCPGYGAEGVQWMAMHAGGAFMTRGRHTTHRSTTLSAPSSLSFVERSTSTPDHGTIAIPRCLHRATALQQPVSRVALLRPHGALQQLSDSWQPIDATSHKVRACDGQLALPAATPTQRLTSDVPHVRSACCRCFHITTSSPLVHRTRAGPGTPAAGWAAPELPPPPLTASCLLRHCCDTAATLYTPHHASAYAGAPQTYPSGRTSAAAWQPQQPQQQRQPQCWGGRRPPRLLLRAAAGDAGAASAASSDLPLQRTGGLQARLAAAAAWADALLRFTRPHTMLGTAVSVTSVSALALGPGQAGGAAAAAFSQALSSALLMNICIVGINQVGGCWCWCLRYTGDGARQFCCCSASPRLPCPLLPSPHRLTLPLYRSLPPPPTHPAAIRHRH